MGAHIIHAGDRRRLRRLDGPLQQARNQPIEQAAQHFLKLFAFGRAGELRFHFLPAAAELGDPLAGVFDFEQARGEAIVQVGRVVGDLIGQIDQLRFQRRAKSGKIFVQRRILALFEIARMLDDALADFKGQVQAGKPRVAVFEQFDDAQGVKIMVEAIAKAAHLAIQLVFARMRERRMADVVAKRKSFGEFFIEIQRRRHGAGNLRHFDGMGEPVTESDPKCRAERPAFYFPGGGKPANG